MANSRELAEQAFALLQDALRESEARAAELSEQLRKQPAHDVVGDDRLERLAQKLDAAETERDRLRTEVGQLEEVLAAERAKAEQLKAKLEVAESGPDKLTKKEINFWRSKVEEFDHSAREYKSRLAQLRRDLNEREAQLEAMQQRERERDAAAAEAEHVRETLKKRDARIAELSAELESIRAELNAKNRQRQQLENQLAERESSFGKAREQAAELSADLEAAREQIEGLEHELREEKECVNNLSEVANQRRERITDLEDRLAEAEERYEEATWRLGKSRHFERLVKRRKRLIRALIERIRTKSKANVALKAGLDALRTYKASAEAKQHELLARNDKLKAKIKEQEETIARHQGQTPAEERLDESVRRIAELEKRLEDQVEIIQALEDELKASKALKRLHTEHTSEVERLRGELEAKSQLVAQLQSDSDEQQRKLAKLRGSESETLRMKSRVKEHETTIGQLTEAVDAWKRKYELMSVPPPDDYKAVGVASGGERKVSD